MPERVVSVRLQAKVEGFTAGMRKAKASVDDLTKADVPKAAKGYKDLADTAALAGAAIAVGLGAAVKRFADFDQAMSAVKANSGATSDELNRLREAAIKLGADSQFSATEAAQGINELAKAGVSSQSILQGGLKGALDLAAAGQIDVAQAAETTASALTQFKLSGDDAVKVADLLTNGANKAQGGVGDLGAALSQAGLVASATGLTIEETTAGLTAFASAGLIGSDAGTSFKTMLQRLSAPSGEAATLMKELGISAYDSQGNFVGLANVAGQLQKGMENLTPAQRNAALATIFGSDAVRAANVLYSEGAQGIRDWTTQVSEQGAAAKQAATLTDNLNGDLERLGGAFDSVLIQSGSGANDSLRMLVKGLTGVVDAVGKVPGPVLLAATGLGALTLVAPKAIGAYKNFTATLASVGGSLDKIALKAPRTAAALEKSASAAKAAGKAFATAAAVAGTANTFLTDDTKSVGVQKLTKDLLDSADAVTTFSGVIKKNAADMGFIQGDLENFGNVLRATFNPDFLDSFTSSGDAALNALSLGMIDLNTTTDEAATRLGDLDGVLSGLVSSGNAQGAASLFDQFATAAEAQGISVDELKTKLPGYTEALAGVANASSGAADGGSELITVTDDMAVSAEDAKKAWDNLKDAIDGLGSPTAQARAAQRGFTGALNDVDSALETYRESLVKQREEQIKAANGGKDLSKAQKRAAQDYADAQVSTGRALKDTSDQALGVQAALDGIRQATLDKVLADYKLTGSTDAATAAMKKGKDEFVKAAIEAGYTKTEAEKLATQLGLIPDNVDIIVKQSGAEQAAAEISAAAINRESTIWVTKKFRTTDLSSDFQGVGGRALGGAIYGPGSGTSDTAGIFALSNGEHVLTASDVAKLGGQSAVYALRQAVQTGRFPGLARGGAVQPQYAPRVQVVSIPSGGPSVSTSKFDQRVMPAVMNVYEGGSAALRAEAEDARFRRGVRGAMG